MPYSRYQPLPKRLKENRPRGRTKTGGVVLRGVLYGFPVPSEGQDGTLGAGG